MLQQVFVWFYLGMLFWAVGESGLALNKLQQALRDESSVARSEAQTLRCGRILALRLNVENASLFLDERFADHRQEIQRARVELLADIEIALHAEDCEHGNRYGLQATIRHTDNRQLARLWPNWVGAYRRDASSAAL